MCDKIRSLSLFVFLLVSLTSAAASQTPSPVHYTIRIDAADLTGVDVEMRFLTSRLPTRIAMAAHPEYDDRYYRYIENLTATSDARPVTVTREQDPVWRLDGAHGAVVVKYRLRFPPQVNSFREAWKPFLTPTGGMVGDLHTLMYIVGGEKRRARLTLDMPAGWKAASGLEPTPDARTFTGTVEHMLDAPVMLGKFEEWKFEAGGVPHKIVLWSSADANPVDTAPIVQGIKGLADEAIKAFGKPPYPRYAFLLDNGGQAALEHATSVNIGVSRELNDTLATTGHEYVHVWNLMDVRPRERIGVKYRFADPTGVLWWNEGATIMFADLLIRRTGLSADGRTRIARLESLFARYLNAPGNSELSAELVSRGDSHPLLLGDNSTSTHLQGEVLTTMLDLWIRDKTDGRRDTTHAMRLLASRFDSSRGITNRDLENALRDTCRCDMSAFFRDHIYGAKRIDFDRYLKLIGLQYEVKWTPAVGQDGKPSVDLRIGPLSFEGGVVLRITNPQSAWGKAGLHTGDKLVSVDGKPVAAWADFRNWLRQLKVGDVSKVVVERGGATHTAEVHIVPYDIPTVRVFELPDAKARQLRLRAAWINSN